MLVFWHVATTTREYISRVFNLLNGFSLSFLHYKIVLALLHNGIEDIVVAAFNVWQYNSVKGCAKSTSTFQGCLYSLRIENLLQMVSCLEN